MIEIFYLIKFVLFQVLGLFIALGAGAVFVFLALLADNLALMWIAASGA